MESTPEQQPAPERRGALEIVWRPVSDLTPYIRNARLHPEEQIEALANSIRRFGFNVPVGISSAGGLRTGHARVLAAKRLGWRDVPTVSLDHLSEEEQRLYILADNRIAEAGETDAALVALELQELHGLGLDVGGVGFDAAALEELFAGADEEPEAEDGFVDPEPEERAPKKAGTQLVIGPYRMKIGRDAFLSWQEALRRGSGFRKEKIEAEIRRRLGL